MGRGVKGQEQGGRVIAGEREGCDKEKKEWRGKEGGRKGGVN